MVLINQKTKKLKIEHAKCVPAWQIIPEIFKKLNEVGCYLKFVWIYAGHNLDDGKLDE